MMTQEIISALLEKEKYDLSDLRAVMRVLRSEEGCPWDREQDHHSIRSSLIEEAYEVIEAIDNEDPVLLREELGDLLFQIVFHAELEEETDRFSMDEVIHDITFKMIHRHPHVFGCVKVKDSSEVLSNWESIKTEEKQRNTLAERLRAIPPMLPALMRASKVSKKAGLDEGMDRNAVVAEIEERIRGLDTSKGDREALQKQAGELLFSAVKLCRVLDVDAEYALHLATEDAILKIEGQNL